MKNIFEFNALDKDARANYLWDNGTWIHEEVTPDYVKKLYALHDYYVQVCYDLKTNRILFEEVCGIEEEDLINEIELVFE